MGRAAEIDAVLAALLSGQSASWPFADSAAIGDEFVARIRFHGVAGLVAKRHSAFEQLPAPVAAAIDTEAQRGAITEASRQTVVRGMLEALAAAGVGHVLLKGSHLAYSLYDDPTDRTRGDTDVLVREDQRGLAGDVLRALGFTHTPGHRDGLYQATWLSAAEFGIQHEIDLHWRISNSPALASLFDTGLFAGAVPLPKLSPAARGMDNAHLLLHLALNQAWHESSGFISEGALVKGARRLGWTYDIHLLAEALTEDEWSELAETARRSGAAPIILHALNAAERLLGAALPAEAMAKLRAAPRETWLTRYIEQADFSFRLKCDIRAASGLAEKSALLRWHALPPEERLRERFPDRRGWPAWALRLLRLFAGPMRWLRKVAGS